MTSNTGQQIITIHILPNISKSKENQAMKFGQIMKYSMRNISLINHVKNDVGRLVPDLLLLFKKVYIRLT